MAGSLRTIRGVSAIFAATLAIGISVAHAQNMPPQTLETALHQMSDEAGVIFAGQVIAVHYSAGGEGASGVVEVEFRVDQAVRGCAAGTTYVLREWSGLWAGGIQRYRVGQRLLMFLRAPSASGLSSPVDGMDGAVPIHGSRPSLMATSSTAQYPVADLRWIATQVLHPVSYRTKAAHFDHRAGPALMVRADATKTESMGVTISSAELKDEKSAASIPAQQTSVQTMIEMLKSWQKANDVAR